MVPEEFLMPDVKLDLGFERISHKMFKQLTTKLASSAIVLKKSQASLPTLWIQSRNVSNGKSARKGHVTKEQILKSPSTPIFSPSYPHGPYTFINREYFIISYETDPAALRAAVPEPLEPNKDNIVLYEWINMPDSTGFGAYTESGTVIPCTYNGKPVNFTAQMFLDCEPPIAAGREIWGFPKKYAKPVFGVHSDTIFGTLKYADQDVAVGTMTYKNEPIPEQEALNSLSKTQVNLKVIPDVNWKPKIARLVSYNLTNIRLKGAWQSHARLHLLPHINAPAADLPVKKVLGGKHFLADITLPYGQVLHDYITERDSGKVFKSEPGRLSREKILNMCAMPAPAASYGKGPVSLNNREYFIIKYETDPEALRNFLPDCLYANKENLVVAQWINTHGTGLGNYSKFEMFIPCEDEHGNAYNFGVYSFVNSSAAITAGREVWGEPHKFGDPVFEVNKDTINGHLNYAQLKVASGTMPYKHKAVDINQAVNWMTTPHINLKLIPNVRGDAEIAQLVVLEHSKIRVHSAWEGPARLELIPHANAPVADLPVKRVLGGMDIVVDLTLPEGRVFKDYLAEESS